MNILDESELGYIAAMFDGEGCIGLAKKETVTNPGYAVVCDIYNTNKILLNWLQAKIGFGRISPPKNKGPKNKVTYCLSFRKEETKELLSIILPYLIIKHTQATLVLEFIEKSEKARAPISKPDELILEHELIYRELTALNKRGI